MSEPAGAQESHELAFEAFGVCVAVSGDRAEVLERMKAILPPGWRPCPTSAVERRFAITAEESGTYALTRDEELRTNGLDLDLALEVLDTELRLHIGVKTRDYVFVHSGAVAHRGKAILLPGRSFAGKTTLVAALVRAGATYYSDEFAVLDADGRVHPYAKPLSLRGDGRFQTNHSVESLGGTAGEQSVPVGAIVVTNYRPGAEWQPRRLSAGEAAMALLANTVPARERPAEVMQALSRAADGAVALESDRDEADAIAALLLAEAERLTA